MFSFRFTFLLLSFVSVAAAAPVPLARDQFISQIATDLSAHFKLEGELQLELLRPWAPPARVAETWMLEMLEYPSVPAASMLVRCRILADGAAVGDATLVL